MDILINESCVNCGEGIPVSTGVHGGQDGQRVRWAFWSCGHSWSSDRSIELPKERGRYVRRALAAAGVRRHAPLLH